MMPLHISVQNKGKRCPEWGKGQKSGDRSQESERGGKTGKSAEKHSAQGMSKMRESGVQNVPANAGVENREQGKHVYPAAFSW